jgi:hypothetical protein
MPPPLLLQVLLLLAPEAVAAATACYKWFTKNEESAYLFHTEMTHFKIRLYAFNGMKKKQKYYS